MKKRIVTVMLTYSYQMHLTKDPCSYLYYLAKKFGWESTYVYFSDAPLHHAEYEAHCRLIYLGAEQDYEKEIELAGAWLTAHAKEYDVVSFFNYGHSTYYLSRIAHHSHPGIVTWSKLDMGEGGFSHFYDGTRLRSIKAAIEVWKSRHVDLFSVETRHFYECLKQTATFRGRIEYVTNGVSLLGVDLEKLDAMPKDGSILTIGRLGTHQKNTELFLGAVEALGPEILQGRRVICVGGYPEEWKQFLQELFARSPWMREIVQMVGPVSDRQEMYAYCTRASIICMPSRWESFGIATVEGMYFGVYPVVTEYGSIVQDVTDGGRLGTIVQGPEPTIEAFADGIREGLRRSTPEMGERVRAFARERFNYSVLSRQLDAILQHRMAQKS